VWRTKNNSFTLYSPSQGSREQLGSSNGWLVEMAAATISAEHQKQRHHPDLSRRARVGSESARGRDDYGLTNILERATGVDLDGDGDVGVDGNQKEGLEERHAAAHVAKHVDLEGWYLELSVRKLQSIMLEHQRMFVTKDVIAFGAPGEDRLKFHDVIPLSEVQHMHDCSEPGRSEGSWSEVPDMFILTTTPSGFNAGRSYCIAVEFPLQSTGKDGEGRPASKQVPGARAVVENQAALLKALEVLIRQAKIRTQSKTFGSMVTRSRLAVKCVFHSLPLQMSVALLLSANFFANATEAQVGQVQMCC
jgi:hypothetical protein